MVLVALTEHGREKAAQLIYAASVRRNLLASLSAEQIETTVRVSNIPGSAWEIGRRDSSLLVQYFARDNQALDLAGTFADGAEFNVAVKLLDRVVFDETVTTVKLHCLIADPDRHFTGH